VPRCRAVTRHVLFMLCTRTHMFVLVVGHSQVPHVDFLTTIDRFIFVTLACLLWAGVESTIVWYVAVYYDGIGAGVTAGGATRRASTGGGDGDGTDVENTEGLEYLVPTIPRLESFPLAYTLDAAFAGIVLIGYTIHCLWMIVPAIHQQTKQRNALDDKYQNGEDDNTSFFRRLHEKAHARKVLTDQFRHSYSYTERVPGRTLMRQMTRRRASVNSLTRV
jgi:hypothetical protein